MIQILGLRQYETLDKSGRPVTKTKEDFFNKKWRAQTVGEVFKNTDKILADIPQEEHYNLYFTVASCLEERGRKLDSQYVVPFDIDNVDVDKLNDYHEPFFFSTKLKPSEATGCVALFSGNGLQYFIEMKKPIKDDDYFEVNREHYKAICDKINHELKKAELPGHADPSVFSPGRLMRMPGTKNIKPNKPHRKARVLQGELRPIDFTVPDRSPLEIVPPDLQVAPEALRRMPPPDTQEVLDTCSFIQSCILEPDEVTEPQWYAMLSVVARLEDGHKLSHEISSPHSSYNADDCDLKIDQALKASGPRTCKNINDLWGKCKTCPHFEKITSPIQIRGESFISTKETGFHAVRMDKFGKPTPGRPQYEDLRRYFEEKHNYITMSDSKIVYTWNKKHWEPIEDTYIESFAQKNFNPTANNCMSKEFKGIVQRTNIRHSSWFQSTTSGHMNFRNGVLNLDTLKLVPHSMEFGFTSVLEYDYDPKAKAKKFEKFMRDITLEREELQDVLIEFAGFAFSGQKCNPAKALILLGEGANGKSTFMNVLKKAAGGQAYSSLTLEDMKGDANRYMMHSKLFNISEETPTRSLVDSSLFKNLVSGGEVVVKMLYKQPFVIRNRTKLILACNELPKALDTSFGLFRRLIIVPFNATFEGDRDDKDIEEKLEKELPGIFNVIIEGYRRLQKQTHFSHSDIIKKRIEAYMLATNSVAQWMSECVDVNKDSMVEQTIEHIFSRYARYMDEARQRPVHPNTFSKEVRRLVKDDTLFFRKALDGRRSVFIKGFIINN